MEVGATDDRNSMEPATEGKSPRETASLATVSPSAGERQTNPAVHSISVISEPLLAEPQAVRRPLARCHELLCSSGSCVLWTALWCAQAFASCEFILFVGRDVFPSEWRAPTGERGNLPSDAPPACVLLSVLHANENLGLAMSTFGCLWVSQTVPRQLVRIAAATSELKLVVERVVRLWLRRAWLMSLATSAGYWAVYGASMFESSGALREFWSYAMPVQTFIFSHSQWRLICMLGCALDVAGCAAQPLRAAIEAHEADALRVVTAEYARLLRQHAALLHLFRRRSCGFLDAYVLFVALDSVYQIAGTLVTALQVSFGPGVFMDPGTDDAFGMDCMLYNATAAAAGDAPTFHLTLGTFLSNLLPTLDRAAMLAAILLLVSRHSDRSSGLTASLVRQLTDHWLLRPTAADDIWLAARYMEERPLVVSLFSVRFSLGQAARVVAGLLASVLGSQLVRILYARASGGGE